MDLDYSASNIDLDASLDGTVSIDLLRKQLADLLVSLYEIGRALPQTLVFLSEVAQPDLRQGSRIPVLGSMFDELPKLFTAPRTTELDKMLMRPPNDAVSLKLLLSLRDVALILDSLSYLQLLHLSNYVPSSNSPETQVAYLRNLQMLFKSWDEVVLQHLHTEMRLLMVDSSSLMELKRRIRVTSEQEFRDQQSQGEL